MLVIFGRTQVFMQVLLTIIVMNVSVILDLPLRRLT